MPGGGLVDGGVRRAIGTRHRRTARHRGVWRDDARSYVTAGLCDLLGPFRFRAPPWEAVRPGQRAGTLPDQYLPGRRGYAQSHVVRADRVRQRSGTACGQ
jgi:hypothetical protein